MMNNVKEKKMGEGTSEVLRILIHIGPIQCDCHFDGGVYIMNISARSLGVILFFGFRSSLLFASASGIAGSICL